MPPKAKFTKQEIVCAALKIVQESGTSELTARSLAKKLQSSACPIFTVFNNMEEVLNETTRAAKKIYADYINLGLKEKPAFKGVGMQYINFAIKEPKLFQLLFMEEKKQRPSINNVLPVIDENYQIILSSVESSYALDKVHSEILYKHLWIYSHGIASLCATNMCSFSSEEIGRLISEVCKALLIEIKGS